MRVTAKQMARLERERPDIGMASSVFIGGNDFSPIFSPRRATKLLDQEGLFDNKAEKAAYLRYWLRRRRELFAGRRR